LNYKALVLEINGLICDYDGILDLEAAHSIKRIRMLSYDDILASRVVNGKLTLAWSLPWLIEGHCFAKNGVILMTLPSDIKLFFDKSKSLEAYDLFSKKLKVFN
jgi:hypothetical protein